MTSLTSLNKPAARYSFTSSFNTGIILVNIVAFFMITFMPFVDIENLMYEAAAKPGLIFSFTSGISIDNLVLFTFIQTMVTASMVFGFVHNKRASTAYLSLPIRRSDLFFSKYASGLISVIIPHIINLTLKLYTNLQVFGFSMPLIQGYVLIMFGTLVAIFSLYSITSAVCLRVGTKAEGLIFAFVIMFGAIIAAISLMQYCGLFLHGYSAQTSSLGMYAASYLPAVDCIVFIYKFGGSLIAEDIFNPPASISVPFWGSRLNGAVMLVIWPALSVFASYLAYNSFKKYKAENSGVLGTDKLLNSIGIFISVFFASGIFLTNYALSFTAKILYSLFLSYAIFILIRFLLSFNIKYALKLSGFIQFITIMAFCGVLCALLYTGLFGFSSYQPEIEEIEYAEITYTGSPDFIIGESRQYGNKYIANKLEGEQDLYFRSFLDIKYTSEDDISVILDIHKEIIDFKHDLYGNNNQKIEDINDRITVQVQVRYRLKNGKYSDRQYNSIPVRTALNMLKLDKTEYINNRIDESLKMLSDYEKLKPILITDSFFENEYTLDIYQKEKLFNALRKDLRSLSIDERYIDNKYFPNDKSLAIISFPRMTNKYDLETVSFNIINGNAILVSGGENDVYSLYGANTNSMRLYITESYVNTIEFLNDIGFTTQAPDISDIKEMHVERYRINNTSKITATYFRSYMLLTYTKHKDSLEVDKSEYGNLLNLSKSSYYAAEGGYLVKVLINGQNGTQKWVTLFLPEKDAPEYIKNRF